MLLWVLVLHVEGYSMSRLFIVNPVAIALEVGVLCCQSWIPILHSGIHGVDLNVEGQ